MPADRAPRPGTYIFVNLGCPKNLVDAECVAGRLESLGWRAAASAADASLVVVTTCAFITSAVEESVMEILDAAGGKREGQTLAVLGCLVSREGHALAKLLPEVDLFLDVDQMTSLPERLEELAFTRPQVTPDAGRRREDPIDQRLPPPHRGRRPGGRRLFTPRHLAYLKIADGCSNKCSYCLIPSIRGELRSRMREEIVAEARELASAGVKELVVIAQDTSAWGLERGEGECLYDLLEGVAGAARFEWIRLMYLHPAHIDLSRLVPLVSSGTVIPYLDIPIQHASDRILEAMNRPYRRRELERLFEELRSAIDDLVLRTTVMVGFPGETDEEFRELVDFIEEVSFDHVGVFSYSPEKGTKACSIRPRVAAGVAEERKDELLTIQLDISHERLSARIGSSLDVLVDAKAGEEEAQRPGVEAEGRFYGQAYDVDGVTYLTGGPVRPGELVRARVLEAEPYDIIARVIPEPPVYKR
jgi:ribosomal protein S12 methylthiotransferase